MRPLGAIIVGTYTDRAGRKAGLTLSIGRRSGVGGADHPALGFAPERETMPPEIALAYASVFKEPRATVPVYEPRWTVWGAPNAAKNIAIRSPRR